METTILPPQQEPVPFWRTKLPLILIPIVLLLFNYFLYTRLQAEQTEEVVVAETVEMAETDSAEIASALTVPNEGLNLRPAAGTLVGTGWRVIRGSWQAEEAGLRQTTVDGFDLAVSYEAQRFDTYALEVVLKHMQNIGGGVYINMQEADTTASSHMIRFETDGSAMFWGSFDDAGVFTGQGFANVDIDPMMSHNLRIAVHNNRYDIALDGQLIAEAIPLQHVGGHVGLMATEADVLFEDVKVVPIDGVGTAPVVVEDLLPEGDALLQQVETVNGNWVYENNTIRQVETEATDYLTMLNTLGKSYTLRASVLLPEKEAVPDSGAGFIFHMPERDNRASGHMVRLLEGGDQIMWGKFDAEGVFEGQGNIGLSLEPNVAHEIAVHVYGMNFDILINGDPVVTELPLTADEGWIGLVAYRGVVTFSDVNLTLGGN